MASGNVPLSIDALLEDPNDMRIRFAWEITKNVGYYKRERYNLEANERLNTCSDEAIFRIGRLVDSMEDRQRRRILFDVAKLSPQPEWFNVYMALLEGVVDLVPSHPKVFSSGVMRALVDGLKLMSPRLKREARSLDATPLPLDSESIAEEIALLRFAIQLYASSGFRNLFDTRNCGEVSGIVIVATYYEETVRKNPDQVDDFAALVLSGIRDTATLDRRLDGAVTADVGVTLSDGWL